jgi:hypothetical protein
MLVDLSAPSFPESPVLNDSVTLSYGSEDTQIEFVIYLLNKKKSSFQKHMVKGSCVYQLNPTFVLDELCYGSA